jgi:hypothetical protein
MIYHLKRLVQDFPGAEHQTRCFLHTINLVVKSVIKLFDSRNIKKDDSDENGYADDTDRMLAQLAEGLELEEMDMRRMGQDMDDYVSDNDEHENECGKADKQSEDDEDDKDDEDDDADDDDDDDDDLEDKMALLSEDERVSFKATIAPVRLVLVKVSHLNHEPGR